MCVIADRRCTCGVVGPIGSDCQLVTESKMFNEVELPGKVEHRR